MKKNVLKKKLVIGLIFLFLGASIIPSLCNAIELESKEIKEKEVIPLGDEEKAFYPSDDTTVYREFPNINYCTSSDLVVRNRCAQPECIYDIDSLIKFDLSELYGKEVTYAKIMLFYHKWTHNDPAGRNISLIRITSDWEECQVTFNNQPTYDGESAYISVPNNPAEWMEWDVTNDVQKFVNQETSNYGWKITDPEPWNKPDIPQIYFYSINHINERYWPQLIVGYITSRTSNYNQLYINLIEQLLPRFPLLVYILQLPIFDKLLGI